MKPPHDPKLCFCGDTTDCVCPCEECGKARLHEHAIARRTELLARLHAANIDIEDLADLVWMTIEPAIEKRVAEIAKIALRERLRTIQLVSKVQGF